jgi:hypothetical protein
VVAYRQLSMGNYIMLTKTEDIIGNFFDYKLVKIKILKEEKEKILKWHFK